MTRIICDTMIWYNLSKNKIKIPDPNRYQLVCTYLSLMELVFTPKNFKNVKEVQDAIKVILNIEPEIIMVAPYCHAQKLIDKDFKTEINIEDDLVWGFLAVLLNHPEEALNNNEFKDLLHISSIRKSNSSDWANFLNQLYKPSKEMLSVYRKYRNDLNQGHMRKRLIFKLNSLSEKQYTDSQINWKEFELYDKVGDRYIRNLHVSKMKADANDYNDLRNMLYTQPGNKYWTLEKRWLSIINEIKLNEYLYIES